MVESQHIKDSLKTTCGRRVCVWGGDLLDLCTAEQGFTTLGNTLCMFIEKVCADFLFLCRFVSCKCMFKCELNVCLSLSVFCVSMCV